MPNCAHAVEVSESNFDRNAVSLRPRGASTVLPAASLIARTSNALTIEA